MSETSTGPISTIPGNLELLLAELGDRLNELASMATEISEFTAESQLELEGRQYSEFQKTLSDLEADFREGVVLAKQILKILPQVVALAPKNPPQSPPQLPELPEED